MALFKKHVAQVVTTAKSDVPQWSWTISLWMF